MTTRLVLSPADHDRAVAALIERTPVFLTAPFRCNGLDIARQLFLDYDAAAPLSDEERAEYDRQIAPAPTLPGRYERPLRAPHHTARTEAIVPTRASHPAVPTEWELATHGVLILDELAEFKRFTLEALEAALREPKPGPSLIMIHTQCACGAARPCECPAERRAKWHGRVANLRAMSLQLSLEVADD